MRLTNRLSTAATLVAASLFATSAQAIPLAFSVTGTVGIADPVNDFGLSSGDAVQLTGQFDSAALAGIGLEALSFGNGSGNQLMLTLGAITLQESDAVDFDSIFPTLVFLNGVLTQVEFVTSIFFTDAAADLDSSGLDFTAVDPDGGFIDGSFDAGSFTTREIGNPSVPEPATLTLLGVAALAAGAVRRRAHA